jgi:hypothetical protein
MGTNMFNNSINPNTIDPREINSNATPTLANINDVVSHKPLKKQSVELKMKNLANRESHYQAPYLVKDSKERLYGDSLANKMLKNEYLEENKKLKTRLRHME